MYPTSVTLICAGTKLWNILIRLLDDKKKKNIVMKCLL